MPVDVAYSFRKELEQLAGGCEAGLNVKKLRGREGFRLRVREWRAIYTINNDEMIILVLDAGPRGDIYK